MSGGNYHLDKDLGNMYLGDEGQKHNGLPNLHQSRQQPQPHQYSYSQETDGGPPPPYTTLERPYGSREPPQQQQQQYQQSGSNVQIQVKGGSGGSSRRSPSPFQERSEPQVAVPAYAYRGPQTTYGGFSNPTPAPSKIVHTAPAATSHGYTNSRLIGQDTQSTPLPVTNISKSANHHEAPPTSSSAAVNHREATPPSPTKMKDPRPYQLRPMLDSVVKQDPSTAVTRGKTESEVDVLTDLLMQSMEASADPGFYGMCAKCGRSIMGENAGCSALDQLFHVECFTCYSCSTHLQGKPFFAMEGRPYCEQCYLNTLEKCTVCSKPITDRLLRATGKPYHPQCFMCVVCGKSLDGVPFTVDATNQIHCIPDFHKKFAPRCCICELPIMPNTESEETVRIVAMDRSFHPHCYKCEDCGIVLSSESEGRGCYPLDDHILCKSCNARRIQALTTKMTTEL